MPAAVVRGVLGGEGHRAGVLATGGEALHEAGGDEHEQCDPAGHETDRDQTDGHGTDRHHDHGGGQHLLATDTVAEGAEEDTAEGADEEADGEGGEGGDQGQGVRQGVEEDGGHGHGEVAVDAVVEPLHHVAE